MSSNRIDPSRGSVQVEPARTRQTEAPATPFRTVLASGASAVLTGAEVATSVIAGPVLAAVVHDAGSEMVEGISGAPAGGAGGMSAATADAAAGGDPIAAARLLQKESQLFNLQLLQLQEEVQNENRRFTTLSNVSRARHDTASGCVKNIH